MNTNKISEQTCGYIHHFNDDSIWNHPLALDVDDAIFDIGGIFFNVEFQLQNELYDKTFG
jgi:hypothetical protein